MTERRKSNRIRLWLEIAGGVAGIIVAVVAVMEYQHSRALELSNAEHGAIIQSILTEKEDRITTDQSINSQVGELSKKVDKMAQNIDEVKGMVSIIVRDYRMSGR